MSNIIIDCTEITKSAVITKQKHEEYKDLYHFDFTNVPEITAVTAMGVRADSKARAVEIIANRIKQGLLYNHYEQPDN